MVQMDQFAGQKLSHGCREQTYGYQGGKVVVVVVVVVVVGWCDELGDWD